MRPTDIIPWEICIILTQVILIIIRVGMTVVIVVTAVPRMVEVVGTPCPAIPLMDLRLMVIVTTMAIITGGVVVTTGGSTVKYIFWATDSLWPFFNIH